MTEEKTQGIDKLLEIAETGLAEGSSTPSLEAQLSAIVRLSELDDSKANDYVLGLSKYSDYRDPKEMGDDFCYPLIFEFPNVKGLLGKEITYKVYVNDTAPSPEDWGKFPFNESGRVLTQCIARVKTRKQK